MSRPLIAALIGLSAAALYAQDAPVLSPQNYQREIDNAWVRVWRHTLAPRAKEGPHQHPALVVVYLTDARLRFTAPDGKGRQLTRKAGEVAWFDPEVHIEENLSDQPLETVVIELKDAKAPAGAQKVTLDPVKLDPQHHTVPLENARVRVLRTVLEPHLKGPTHEHPHYVVVYLTELHTTMTLADGKAVDNPRRPGEIAWRDFMKHTTENIGDHTAVELQIELK